MKDFGKLVIGMILTFPAFCNTIGDMQAPTPRRILVARDSNAIEGDLSATMKDMTLSRMGGSQRRLLDTSGVFVDERVGTPTPSIGSRFTMASKLEEYGDRTKYAESLNKAFTVLIAKIAQSLGYPLQVRLRELASTSSSKRIAAEHVNIIMPELLARLSKPTYADLGEVLEHVKDEELAGAQARIKDLERTAVETAGQLRAELAAATARSKELEERLAEVMREKDAKEAEFEKALLVLERIYAEKSAARVQVLDERATRVATQARFHKYWVPADESGASASGSAKGRPPLTLGRRGYTQLDARGRSGSTASGIGRDRGRTASFIVHESDSSRVPRGAPTVNELERAAEELSSQARAEAARKLTPPKELLRKWRLACSPLRVLPVESTTAGESGTKRK